MEQKKVNSFGGFAILALYLVSMAFSIVTPAMATFAAKWGAEYSQWISLISTLPTLFIVVGTFLAGALMGKRMKYRTLAILASVIALIGGTAPALFDNFFLMLGCRALFGLGMGLMAPLGNALILGLYEGQKQASMLGYGTLCMNVGGIAMQLLGGTLAGSGANGWQLVFWAHLLLIISLVMALFLPEPAALEEKAAETGKKEPMGKMIYVIAAIIFFYNLFVFPVMMYISILFEQRNAGGAAAASVALSLYTVAGAVAGSLFGTLFSKASRYILSLGFLCAGAGMALILIGQSGFLMTAGLVIAGFGFSCFFPAFMAWAGMATPPATVAAASSFILALMNLSGFVSSFYISALNAIAGDNYLVVMIIIAAVYDIVCGAIFFVATPFKKQA